MFALSMRKQRRRPFVFDTRIVQFPFILNPKGPVTGYGKLTWEFAHAWNFMKLCTLIVLVMTAIIMVYSLVNSIPLANYDVIYDVTMIAKGTPL